MVEGYSPPRSTIAAAAVYLGALAIFAALVAGRTGFLNTPVLEQDDYGLLDAGGRLLEDPVCYRDHRTDGALEIVFRTVPREAILAD